MLDGSHAAMGVAAGCIAMVGEAWYNWTVWTGRSRPDPMGRWVLAVSGWLTFSSHVAVGGAWSSVAPLAIAVGMSVSAVLASRQGGPWVLGGFERAALTVAALGVAAWVLFGLPIVTLLALIAVDAAAMALNIRRAWRAPGAEAPGPWAVTVLSDVVNLLAIGGSDHGWIFPWYLLLVNGTMLATVLAVLPRPLGRRAV